MPLIGMNLALYGLGGSEYPVIDRFRTVSDKWTIVGTDYSNRGSDAVRIVASTGLPGTQSADVDHLVALITLDPPELSMTDRYVITWKGAGSFYLSQGKTVSVGDHRYVFDFQGPGSVALLDLKGTSDADPIHDIHVVREDQAAAFAAGQVFNPAFLAKASQWSTLRFMDWGLTNGNQAVAWSDLPASDSVSWVTDRGVPLKVMVDLANAAGTDMWYCIPAHASDDLVTQALGYIRDHLNPNLKLHLEYSNEMWNWGFEQTSYAQQQGRALGKALGLDHDIGNMEWYGYRSAQIARITDDVFGTQSRARVDNVIATQTYWKGLEGYIFDGIKLARAGTAADLFEEYAIATYFGNEIGSGSDADKAKVLGWARAGAAGLDAAFQQLATGGLLESNASLAILKDAETYHAAVARKYGLDLVAYEGGLHVTAMGYPDNSQDQRDMVDFMQRLLADPRMGQLYTQMANDFQQTGGSEIVAFNDVGAISKWGTWGVLDTIYQAHSPRYDALVRMARRRQ